MAKFGGILLVLAFWSNCVASAGAVGVDGYTQDAGGVSDAGSSATAWATPTPSPSIVNVATPSSSPSATNSPSQPPSNTSSPLATSSPSPTSSYSPSATNSPSQTPSYSSSPSATSSPSPTSSYSSSASATNSPSPTPSYSPSVSPYPARTVLTIGAVSDPIVDGLSPLLAIYGIISDADENVFIADRTAHSLFSLTPQRIMSLVVGGGSDGFSSGLVDGVGSSALLNSPRQFAPDTNGVFFFTDFGNNVIRRVTISSRTVTTVAGGGGEGLGNAGSADGVGTAATFSSPNGIVNDGMGNLYVMDGATGFLRRIVISTFAVSTISLSQTITGVTGLAMKSLDFMYIADTAGNRIRGINVTDGIVTIIAGTGTGSYLDAVGTNAILKAPIGLSYDGSQYLYFADSTNHRIRKIDIDTLTVSTVAGSTVGNVNNVGTLARFSVPTGVHYSAGANCLYVTDFNNKAIRKVIL